MINFFKKIIKEPKGMTIIIVLTVVFAVVAVIGAGAVIIANNLNRTGGQATKGKVEFATKEAIEKTKAFYKMNKDFFAGCSTGDCVNPNGSGCVSCDSNDAVYTSDDVSYKIKLSNLTQPYYEGKNYIAGSANLLITSFYKNITKQVTSNICLNYCAVAGYNCDAPDGCGGSCGTCTEPETCGGSGKDRICGSSATNCTDISKECGDDCAAGSTCGGGTIIDETDNIIVSPSGCNGNTCIEGESDPSFQWDNDGDLNETRANDTRNGENNMGVLNQENYAAAYFCGQSQYYSFDDDWYLPAKDELNIINSAIHNGWTTGYAEDYYWSSTEWEGKPNAEVYAEHFYANELGNKPKDVRLNVRCLRRYGTQTPSTCNNISNECTAQCQNGDMCGGGTLIDSDRHIVASLADCDGARRCCRSGGGGTNCEGLVDISTGEWDSSIEPRSTEARDEYSGRRNTEVIPSEPQYVAANYCKGANYFGFSGWYLPATWELGTLVNEAISQGWTSGWRQRERDCYWSSRETDFEPGLAYQVGLGSAYGNCNEGRGNHKQDQVYLRCLRYYD